MIDHRRFPILYVDDDKANLLSFCYAFEKQFWILTADNGEDALRKLMEEDVAVLLTDQRMPQMTGVELCERAAALKPSVVRIIVTAYADMQAATDAINRGKVARYVTKPWKDSELEAILRTGIEVFQMARMVADMELRLLRLERQAAAITVAGELEHEVKQRFTMLRTNLEVLQEMTAKVPDPALRQSVAEVVTDSRNTVEHVLDLIHRIRSGAIDRVGEVLEADAGRVVDMAMGFMRGQITRVAACELLVEGRAMVELAPTELAQVLLNLLTNACEALPPGEPHRNRISVKLATQGRDAVFTIADTGEGIPPERLEEIFKPHFTTKPDGSGLGLPIVKGIVERRGGTIRVESTVGKGTTFVVTLPLLRH